MSQGLILTNQTTHEQMLNVFNDIPCLVTPCYSVLKVRLFEIHLQGLKQSAFSSNACIICLSIANSASKNKLLL